MNKNLWICSMASLLMFSCSDSVNDGPEIEDSGADLSDLYIERDIQDLASDDAQKVAMLFNGGSDPASRAAMATPQVEVVSDPETSAPLLYIVNFGDNEGFTLISATKNTSPVLAYSETGHFDPSIYNEPYEDLKTLAKYSIQDDGDSLRAKYALEWAIYEKPVIPNVTKMSRAMNPGTNLSTEELIKNEIARKQAEGYTYVGPIAAARTYLSETDYNLLVKDISTHTHSNYNYEEVSLFFVKQNVSTTGPLLKTEWHQSDPFCVDSKSGFAGCGPIAIAQITYYHKFPSKYNWNKIAVDPVKNDALVYFMKDIRFLCGADTASNGTATNYPKIRETFVNLGYKVVDGGVPAESSLRQQIYSQNPVYIQGKSSTGGGHAWICDGVEMKTMTASVSYITNGFSLTGTPYEDYSVRIDGTSYMYHMNMGNGPFYNGWVLGPSSSHQGSEYYSSSQLSMFVSKP